MHWLSWWELIFLSHCIRSCTIHKTLPCLACYNDAAIFPAVLGCRGSIIISYQVFSDLLYVLCSVVSNKEAEMVFMCLCLIHYFPVTSFPFSELQKDADHIHLSLSELYFHYSLSRLTNLNLFLSKVTSKCVEDTSKFISSSNTHCKCCTK